MKLLTPLVWTWRRLARLVGLFRFEGDTKALYGDNANAKAMSGDEKQRQAAIITTIVGGGQY